MCYIDFMDIVILISLEVRMKNGSGLISLCYPFLLLESVIDKLATLE